MAKFDDYLRGTDEVESVRLGIQHRLWSAQAAAAWERAGVGPGCRVLDVGCGPGYASADLAELVGPRGRVLGIDGSPKYAEQFGSRMERLGHAHAEARRGDVHEAAAIAGDEAGTFDAAFCRWVFSFSPDPAGLVAEIGRCLKPGGRVVIQDYFNWRSMTIAPRRAAFTRAVEGILAYWEGNDGSNDVMGAMPRHLRACGFDLTHFQPIQRIARPGEPLWSWPDSFWPSILPRVAEAGFLSRSEVDAFTAMWAEASADPDTFVVTPAVYDCVAVRAS